MREEFLERARSIAGAALVALGIFIFHQNLNHAAILSTHILAPISGKASGVMPSVILACWRVAQAYAADHQQFLRALLQHTLVLAWPLVLVVVGAILSGDTSADGTHSSQKKDCGLVDSAVGRSTLK